MRFQPRGTSVSYSTTHVFDAAVIGYKLPSMPDTPSITIIKRFSYRGLNEEFSNKYHFSGTVPADAAAWKTLADGIIAAEKLCTGDGVSFVRAYGYVAGNENSVAQIDYTVAPNVVVAGSVAKGTGIDVPGDVAATIRWWTGEYNSRGKKIYCRKYMHGVWANSVDADSLNGTMTPLMQTYAAKLIDGTLPGSFKYCGPQGAVLSLPLVDPFLTTRTLKRRGKRPLPSAP